MLLEPEVRVLSPGDNAVYAFEIYDGLKGDTPDLQMATAVIRDGKAVYQSPFAPVAASPNSGGKIRAIPVAATLALAPDMPAGAYTLEVTIRGANTKRSNGSSGSTSRSSSGEAPCRHRVVGDVQAAAWTPNGFRSDALVVRRCCLILR